jgi:hypothetical protein
MGNTDPTSALASVQQSETEAANFQAQLAQQQMGFQIAMAAAQAQQDAAKAVRDN